MAIIAIQNEIARSSIGFENVMMLVIECAMALTGATGAVIELVDGDAMLYRAACGSVAGFVGLRIPRAGSLSGRCVRERAALYSADTSCDDRVDRAACQPVGVAQVERTDGRCTRTSAATARRGWRSARRPGVVPHHRPSRRG